MSLTTINLGLVKSIEVGLTPPSNTAMLWYDSNAGVKVHKYYDTVTSVWTLLGATPLSIGITEIPIGDGVGGLFSSANFKFSNGGILIKGLNQASGDFIFESFDSLDNPLFKIQNNGNIGIGITTSTSKLYVKGSSDISQFIVQGHSIQSITNPLVQILKSDGTELLRINSDYFTNIFMGFMSGANNDFLGGGVDNTFYGENTGRFNSIGSLNTFIGKRSGENNITGGANTSVGAGAGQQNSIGGGNSYFGYHSGVNTLSSNNAMFGSESGVANTSGQTLSFFGRSSGGQNMTGNGLTFSGFECGLSNKTGNNNTYSGSQAGYLGDDGSLNAYFGLQSGYSAVHANYVTSIGSFAGFNNLNDGSVFLGYAAGFYETQANKLFIDNKTRANEVDGRIKSLIYGIFAGTPSGQTLSFNAENINIPYAPVSNAGMISGQIYFDTAANALANGDLIAIRKV